MPKTLPLAEQGCLLYFYADVLNFELNLYVENLWKDAFVRLITGK